MLKFTGMGLGVTLSLLTIRSYMAHTADLKILNCDVPNIITFHPEIHRNISMLIYVTNEESAQTFARKLEHIIGDFYSQHVTHTHIELMENMLLELDLFLSRATHVSMRSKLKNLQDLISELKRESHKLLRDSRV